MIRDQHYVMHLFWRSRTRSGQPYRLICRFSRLTGKPRHHWVGVQQGDPLGPLLFSIALQKLILSIHNDESCTDLLLNVWYLDDGVLAGHLASVSRALDIIQSEGPSLGFHVNLKKCELFSPSVLSLFPTSIPSSNIPNFELLGVPISDTAFCSSFTARKCFSPYFLT